MKEKEILKWMKKFSFTELLKWIQCTCIHPNNSLYQIRFEKLLALLITIDKKEFENNKLSREDFKCFIDNYYVYSNSTIAILEDFNTFDQTKLIPYFYNGDKRYIFYGSLERPIEFIEKFDYMYLNSNLINDKIKSIFKLLIDFQTELLLFLTSLEESNIKCEQIHTPSNIYCDSVWEYFIIEQDLLLKPITRCDNEYDYFESTNFFNSPFITDGEKNYFIIPQLHIEILFTLANRFLSIENSKLMLENLKHNMIKSLAQIGNYFEIVENILNNKNQKVNDENIIIYKYNEEIIFLFYLLNGTSEDNHLILSKEITKIFKNITTTKSVKFKYLNGQISSLVSTKDIEFIPITIYQTTKMNKLILEEEQDIEFLLFEYLDFRRMTDQFKNMEELYKYLRELRVFNHSIHTFDEIDKLGFYMQSNKKFFEIGEEINIRILPHQWYDYYMEHLYNKYSDDVYDYLEQIKPYYYNRIIKIKDSVFECFNSINLNGGIMSKNYNCYSFIRYPFSGYKIKNRLTHNIVEKVIKPLFSEYTQKVIPYLSDILKQFHFSFGDIYYLELIPLEMINEIDSLNFLKEYIKELTTEKPISIITLSIKEGKEIHSFIIFNTSNLINIFDHNENLGERYCVKELILSILKYNFSSDEKIMEFSKEILETLCPLSKRRYGITTFELLNKRSEFYGKYLKINKTDLSKTRREIAKYLKKISINPGVYKDEDANQLNLLILKFLSEKMTSELSKFKNDILEFAYTQLEYLENQRNQNLKQRKYDLSTNTDFDVIEKLSEEDVVISNHAMAIRYIINSILKQKPEGYKMITRESWSILLSIGFIINDTSAILDLSKHNLQANKVIVTNLYEIKDEFENIIFNEPEYITDSTKSKLREKIERRLNINLSEKLDLNNTFYKEFKFFLQDMLNILYILGISDLDNSTEFPINKFKKTDVINYLIENYDYSDGIYLERIIDFLSLDFNTFKSIDIISESNLMRYKYRLNLCPIILLEDNYILFGNQMCLSAINLWTSYLSNGNLPYQIKFPSSIEKELKRIHKEKDMLLENIAKEISCDALGKKYVEANILNFKRISNSFPPRPDCGEIDLLAVNPYNKVVFVIDAKNVNKRFRIYDIAREIQDFFEGEKCYYNKLCKKYDFIKDNIESVLKYFDLEYSSDWIIKKAFVVNYVYPSGYIKEDIDFILIEDLVDYLLK